MAESKTVVMAALVANGAIAVLKFGGFLLTGSSAMLSETYHSISDTGNQIFLLIGIRYSERAASDRHPFGFGRAQFFYSFLVAVMLFGIAGWESAKHGYDALVHGGGHGPTAGEAVQFLWFSYQPPAWLDPVWVNYAVLGGAFVFESWALYKANQGITAQMEERGWDSYREAFHKTSDVTTLTALTEDTIALAGIVLAFLGVFLTQFTGNPAYDAASALLIGMLLMGFAVALAVENKRLILGESQVQSRVGELRQVVAEQEGVVDVVDFRTVYVGPGELLVTTDIAFADGFTTDGLEAVIADVEDALVAADEHVRFVYVEPVA